MVSLCSYYSEIASLIHSNHYFELINIDIVRENGQSTVPMCALSDISKTLVKILDEINAEIQKVRNERKIPRCNLSAAIREGEESGRYENFVPVTHLKELKAAHIKDQVPSGEEKTG